jgi:hypothetical protein
VKEAEERSKNEPREDGGEGINIDIGFISEMQRLHDSELQRLLREEERRQNR